MTMIIVCIVLGLVSFVMAQIISVSQIVSLFRTKNTSGVSIWTYVIFMVAGIMCLTWGFSYYFQEMMRHAAASSGTDQAVFYVLYQWTIIPIIAYYITDFCMSTIMMIIKARHLSLCKKLKMDELKLADYLTDRANKKYLKSGKKFVCHPNFGMILTLSILATTVVLFMVLFTLYATPPVIYQYSWEGFPWVVPCSLMAALLWEAISWPQFIKSLRQKDTSGISMNWAIFMPISLTISFTYALALALKNGDMAYDTLGALIFNGMIVNYGILILKIINRRKAKAMGLTELEYTKKVLIPAYKKKLSSKPKKLTRQEKAQIKKQKTLRSALEAQKVAKQLNKEKLAALSA